MSAKMEEIIGTAVNKIVLKCEVKAKANSPAIATSKIGQKVTLLSSPSPSKHPQSSSKQPQQQALVFLCRGKGQFTRGAYQSSLEQYRQALQIYDKIKSKRYYGVLLKMVECEKKLKRYNQTKRLYEQISLVYGDV